MRSGSPDQRTFTGAFAALAGAVSILLLSGCDSLAKAPVINRPPASDPDRATPDGGSGGGPVATPDAGNSINIGDLPTTDGGAGAGEAGAGAGNEQVLIYAHSGSDLYAVDPQTLQLRRIGRFTRMAPVGAINLPLNTVTDIAVDARGRIVGLTFGQLLEIDPLTAVCKVIATLPQASFNGLSWIRTDGGAEILVATGLDGRVFRIDPATGMATVLGTLGNALKSSGDLVSVANYGTLLTVRGPGPDDDDRLARVDPATGVATVIGPTGFKTVWGLGFWGNKVFGFTDAGEFILVDPKTGTGTLVRRDTSFRFWGAGVTTSVPVID